MAPELFEDGELSINQYKAVDIWASGVLAFHLLSGLEFPFDSITEENDDEENQEQIRQEIKNSIMNDSPDEKINELEISSDAKDFIK